MADDLSNFKYFKAGLGFREAQLADGGLSTRARFIDYDSGDSFPQ